MKKSIAGKTWKLNKLQDALSQHYQLKKQGYEIDNLTEDERFYYENHQVKPSKFKQFLYFIKQSIN